MTRVALRADLELVLAHLLLEAGNAAAELLDLLAPGLHDLVAFGEAGGLLPLEFGPDGVVAGLPVEAGLVDREDRETLTRLDGIALDDEQVSDGPGVRRADHGTAGRAGEVALHPLAARVLSPDRDRDHDQRDDHGRGRVDPHPDRLRETRFAEELFALRVDGLLAKEGTMLGRRSGH